MMTADNSAPGLMANTRLLLRGSIAAFLIQGAGACLIFLSELMLARVLGTKGFGLFAMVAAWLQVVSMPALMGTNHLLLRYVPAYLSSLDWSLLRGIVRKCTEATLLFSISILLAAAVLLSSLPGGLAADVRISFMIGLAALPFYALSLQRQAILRGLHNVSAALIPEHIVRPTVLICFVSALAWSEALPASAPNALAANGIAFVVAFLTGWYWQRRAMPAAITSSAPELRTREWFAVAFPMFLIAAMQLLLTRIDIMMLGAMVGREQTGIYAAATRISDVIVFALASANTIAAPMIAAFHARSDSSGLQHMMRTLAKGVMLATLPLVFFVVLYGESFLAIFGEGYRAGYHPLVILVLGQMVNALCGPVGYLMVMTGHQKQSLRILITITSLNLALNTALIPAFGVMGAAIATAISVTFWNVLMLRFVRRHLGLDSSILSIFARRA